MTFYSQDVFIFVKMIKSLINATVKACYVDTKKRSTLIVIHVYFFLMSSLATAKKYKSDERIQIWLSEHH